MSILEGLPLLLTALGLWVANKGLDTWKLEHVGKRNVQLAEDTLALFYEAEDALRVIRSPMSYSSETDDVQIFEHESQKEFKARKNAAVVFKRYQKYSDLFNRIHSMRYRFMAQIGREESKPFDDIRIIVNEVVYSATALTRLWAYDFEDFNNKEERIQKLAKYEAIFWEGMIDPDPINTRVIAVIANLESICNQIIKSNRSKLFPPRFKNIISWKKASSPDTL